MDRGRFAGVHAEAKSTSANLTASDRRLLRSYLGYQAVKQLTDLRKKDKNDACLFIASSLWVKKPEKLEKHRGLETSSSSGAQAVPGWRTDGQRPTDVKGEYTEDEEEEEEFDLEELMDSPIPRIFTDSMEDLVEMFLEARQFDDEAQIAAVRSFMVSQR